MSRLATITRNLAVLFVGNIVNKATGAFLFIIIARYVGQIGFGRYAFANAFTALFAIIPDLGLSTLAVRAVARDRSQASKYLGNITMLRALLALLALILTLGGSYVGVAIGRIKPEAVPIIGFIAGSVFFASLSSGLRWSFQAFERLQYESILTGGESLLMLGGGTLVLVLGYGLVELTAVRLGFSILAFVAGLLLTMRRIARPTFELDWAFCQQLIISAAPFIGMLVFSRIYFNFDTVILGLMKGDAENGRYNAAYRFITMLQMIPGLFQFAIFPVMVGAAARSKEALIRVVEPSFRYIIIIALAIGVVTTIFAEPIIRLVYGASYTEAVSILRVLVWMNFFYFVMNVSSSTAIACHREHAIVKISGISLVVNVTLNLLLISWWGAIGASIAILVSEGVACGLLLYQVVRSIDSLPFRSLFARPALAAVFTAIPAFLLRDANPFIGVGGVAIVYLVALLLSRAIPEEDLNLARAFIKRGL